ncbi:MAG TPA: 1-deoxy-D-xylulose-5-phosphate reductoisomerase, partial [Kiloniellaceae bacterium]|nr:1-deoxy-D-xylulose-5-phosphate reductoisomerase [Kiloniellaceae bacterium]
MTLLAEATTAEAPAAAPRSVTILGSTGSIGKNTLDLIERNPESFQVVALTARRSVALLAEQARRTRAELAVVADEACYGDLKAALSGSGIEVAAGAQAVEAAAARPADFTMAAIVGAAGLLPTLTAVRRGAVVGLANKETLVCAGSLMTEAVTRAGAKLLPVDSEHNAIYQVLEQDKPEAVSRIILTASGGPFRQRSREEMARMTPDQAVAHP